MDMFLNKFSVTQCRFCLKVERSLSHFKCKLLGIFIKWNSTHLSYFLYSFNLANIVNNRTTQIKEDGIVATSLLCALCAIPMGRAGSYQWKKTP